MKHRKYYHVTFDTMDQLTEFLNEHREEFFDGEKVAPELEPVSILFEKLGYTLVYLANENLHEKEKET